MAQISSNTRQDKPTTLQATFNPLLAQIPTPKIPPGVLEPTRPSLPPLPSAPPATVAPVLTPPPQTLPVPAAGAKTKVRRVEVLGSTVFSAAELNAAVASFIGKDATFEDLLAIRAAITDLYTSRGYTTSGAFLPSQDVTDGVIKIQVVEGELERIEIHGLRHLRSSYVRDRLRLATQSPVNLTRLEAALQLLQRDPLLTKVQAELTAGTATGLSVLNLNLKEAPQITSTLVVENRDSPSIGEVGGTALVTEKDLLGLGDRLSADIGFTAGVRNYDISYDIPLNARDGTLSLRYANNNNQIIEQPFAPLDINGRDQTYALSFRQPVIRTPNTELALSLSADMRQSQTFLLKNIPFSFSEGPQNGRARVNAIRFSQDWVKRSPNQTLAARSQFSLGLGVLGATVNNTGPDGRFFSWVGQVQLVRALAQDTLLIARAGLQLTPNSLLPLEQFSIGGIDTVRGYRQDQQVGDNGFVGSVELRLPIVRDRIGLIQLAPFLDVGKIWNHGGANVVPSTLAGAGLGLRWQIDPVFSASFDWGIPLNRVNNRGNSLQDNGIYFSIQVQPF